jgi:hypothetical protein
VEGSGSRNIQVSTPIFDWRGEKTLVNPLKAELNPIRHLRALVGARHIVHVSSIRVKYQITGPQVDVELRTPLIQIMIIIYWTVMSD